MLFIIVFLGALSVFLLVYGIYLSLNRERLTIVRRMQGVAHTLKRQQELDDELSKPFFDRIIRPILERLAASIGKSTPVKKKLSLQKKLMMSGNPLNLAPGEFLAIQYVLTLGAAACAALFAISLNSAPGFIVVGIILGAVAGLFLPEYYLKMLANKRKEEIQDNLPDVLDLMTVSVEAGLGFDAALVKVTEKIKGVISQEFTRVLQEIKMGKPRRDALRDLGNRSGVDDLIAFLGSIIQADQLGVSIGNVLRLQSEQMRQKRRQRAEEKAMKAPIKMLIPLILFIFPTIFIVVLGPAALQIIEKF